MQDNQIERVIQLLAHVKAHPKLFVGVDLIQIEHFLNGFDLATGALDIPIDYVKTKEQIISERGWGHLTSIVEEMKQKSLTALEIADELVTIRIDLWKRVLSNSDLSL